MNPNDADELEGEIPLISLKPYFQVEFMGKHIPAYVPQYATEKSAGADLKADIPSPVVLDRFETKVIPTGLRMGIEEGFEIQIRSRSGLAAKNGVFTLNSPGTIDEDYTGEILIILTNLGKESFTVNPGDRIAQAVVSPYVQAEFDPVNTIVKNTFRGAGGLGHTGI